MQWFRRLFSARAAENRETADANAQQSAAEQSVADQAAAEQAVAGQAVAEQAVAGQAVAEQQSSAEQAKPAAAIGSEHDATQGSPNNGPELQATVPHNDGSEEGARQAPAGNASAQLGGASKDNATPQGARSALRVQAVQEPAQAERPRSFKAPPKAGERRARPETLVRKVQTSPGRESAPSSAGPGDSSLMPAARRPGASPAPAVRRQELPNTGGAVSGAAQPGRPVGKPPLPAKPPPSTHRGQSSAGVRTPPPRGSKPAGVSQASRSAPATKTGSVQKTALGSARRGPAKAASAGPGRSGYAGRGPVRDDAAHKESLAAATQGLQFVIGPGREAERVDARPKPSVEARPQVPAPEGRKGTPAESNLHGDDPGATEKAREGRRAATASPMSATQQGQEAEQRSAQGGLSIPRQGPDLMVGEVERFLTLKGPGQSAGGRTQQGPGSQTEAKEEPADDYGYQRLSSAFARAEMEGDLDRVFQNLAQGDLPPGVAPVGQPDDEVAVAANAELFRQMAYNHSRPLREFMLDLSMGPATKQWIEVVRPIVENLQKGAAALQQRVFADALQRFGDALVRARREEGGRLTGDDREALLSAYEALSAELPNVFDFAGERALREPLLVDHLLRQVPGVYKTTIDKLYAAGLGSLEALCRSTTEDLVALGRLDPARADAIVERFRDYRHEKTAKVNGLEYAQEEAKEKLFSLISRLVGAQDEFRLAEASDDREGKRLARHERQAITLDITILLVQLGEVDLVEALERSPTERKVEQVRKFVAESQGTDDPVRGKVP